MKALRWLIGRGRLDRRLLPTVRQTFDVLPGVADGSVQRPLASAEVNERGEVVIDFVDGLRVNLGVMYVKPRRQS